MASQRTPLYGATTSLGALFEQWNGWELPRNYGNAAEEYRSAWESAAIHDASYAGRLKAVGTDVLDLLHRLSTNAVDNLAPGQGAPTILTTERGRILDLITVVNLGDHVLLLTSPNTQAEVLQWLDRYIIVEDVTLEDITSSTAMIEAIGPGAPSLVKSVTGMDVEVLQPYGSVQVTVDGVEGWVVRRDLAHLIRFDLIVPQESGEKVWQRIVGAGGTPLGLQAYHALRVGLGIPAHGAELGESYNPLEAGLVGAISFTKGCYIGQEVIARLDTYQKVQRRMVSLRLSPLAEVEPGSRLTSDGKEVGTITSVAKIPTTGEGIGMGYVRRGLVEIGAQLGLSEVDGAHVVVESFPESLGPGLD